MKILNFANLINWAVRGNNETTIELNPHTNKINYY